MEQIDPRAAQLRAANEYLRAVTENFAPIGRAAREAASSLAREEARLVVVGNFAAIAFLLSQRSEAGFPTNNALVGLGVAFLLIGAIISILALRFWATSFSHEASENFLAIRREQSKIRADLYGSDDDPVSEEQVSKARTKRTMFQSLGHTSMGAAGASSVIGYACLLKAFGPWIGLP